MRIITRPSRRQDNTSRIPRAFAEYHALPATALDASRNPILALHWDGPLIVSGRLACNDNSPLVSRFKTRPMREAADGKA